MKSIALAGVLLLALGIVALVYQGITYTSRETVIKLSEHLRLAPVMRGTDQEYTYEREVEEFLRWSPYVRRGREEEEEEGDRPPMPSIAQLAELQKFLSSYAGSAQAQREPRPQAEHEPAPPPPPSAPQSPVDDYDDLEAEEVISLLGSLDADDLGALREYEGAGQRRDSVLRAIEGVLARREPAGTR